MKSKTLFATVSRTFMDYTDLTYKSYAVQYFGSDYVLADLAAKAVEGDVFEFFRKQDGTTDVFVHRQEFTMGRKTPNVTVIDHSDIEAVIAHLQKVYQSRKSA